MSPAVFAVALVFVVLGLFSLAVGVGKALRWAAESFQHDYPSEKDEPLAPVYPIRMYRERRRGVR